MLYDRSHNKQPLLLADIELTSDMVMKAVALLAARPQLRSRFDLPELKEEHR